MARGIYYPTKHHIQAVFIKNHTRGRFLSLEIVITSITAALAVGFATYSVAVWDSFLPVTVLAGVFLALSSFSVVKLLDDLPRINSGGYNEVVKHFMSPAFRRDRTAFVGFAENIGFNNVVVALLVFFVIDSLELFGIILATVFIVEMFLILIYGRFIDDNRLHSNKLASFLQAGSYVTFWLAVTPMFVAVIKTVYYIIWSIFDKVLLLDSIKKSTNKVWCTLVQKR